MPLLYLISFFPQRTSSWLFGFVGLVLLGFGVQSLQAQVVVEEEDPFRQQDHAFGLGANLYSYGLGLDFQYFRKREPMWEYTLGLTLSSLKDPREVRIASNFADQGGKDFIPDKRFYVYTMALTGGYQRLIYPNTGFNRLSLRVGVFGGPVLGFMKPYYIEYFVNSSSITNPVRTEQYSAQLHDRNFIIGEADFFEGFGETQIVPALRLGVNATLNLASSALYLRALQVGIQTDIFTKRLNILDEQTDQAVFFSGRIGFLIGNAWSE